jgi:hypothetical protein
LQYRHTKEEVNQSLYRYGQTLRFPKFWGSRFANIRHMKVVRLSPLRTGRFYPTGNIPGNHFCKRLSRAIVRPEGLCQWKIPTTTSGIEPATFRLVAQCRHIIVLCISKKKCRSCYVIIPTNAPQQVHINSQDITPACFGGAFVGVIYEELIQNVRN